MSRRLAVGQVIEILAIVVAGTIVIGLLFGFQLVVLTTESMAPTAPAGSLLIVSSRPPDEVQIDDVIVMNRNSSTLVTHRVVGFVEPTGSLSRPDSAGILAVTKGDANETPDPTPYRLEDDQRVVRLVVPIVGRLLLPIIDRTSLILAFGAVVGAAIAFRRQSFGRQEEPDSGADSVLVPSGADTYGVKVVQNHQDRQIGTEGEAKP